jgi:hypothetical protein
MVIIIIKCIILWVVAATLLVWFIHTFKHSIAIGEEHDNKK